MNRYNLQCMASEEETQEAWSCLQDLWPHESEISVERMTLEA